MTLHGIIDFRSLGAHIPGDHFSLLRVFFLYSFLILLPNHRFDDDTPNKTVRPYKTIRELPDVEDAFKGVVAKAATLFNVKNVFILPFGVMSELLPDKPRAEVIDRLRLQEPACSNEPDHSPRRLSAKETTGL